MKKFLILLCSILTITLFLFADPALAGPGGKIASTIFDSFLGKILFLVLFIIFLPLIILDNLKQRSAEKRTRKDLGFMSQFGEMFDWLSIVDPGFKTVV